LIAAGRFGDAYLVNWKSNVFPGILGRTCDRPCEPACRRGRVEEGGDTKKIKPEPVAICRLKRVAADFKEDIRDGLPKPATTKNGKRIALIGGGPASLTVARDLAPLAITASCSTAILLAGGMMRTQIPKFRLPETVIDEEVGYVIDLGVEFRPGRFIGSMKELLAEGWDAVFVGSGAPPDATSRSGPPRSPRPNIQHRIVGFPAFRSGNTTKIGQRGRRAGRRHNTRWIAAACAKRLGGRGRAGRRGAPLRRDESVAVGKEDARARRHSDPQLSCAESGDARRRQADRRHVRESRRRSATTRRVAAAPGPPVRSGRSLSMRRRARSRSARRTRFPWIERDVGIDFDQWGMPGSVDKVTMAQRVRACSSAATPAFGPKNIIWPSRTATTPRSPSTSIAPAKT
jgi:hypothetical protein